SQVYGEERTRGGSRGDERTARLVWQASVAPRGRATFVVFAGNPAAELPHYVTDLAVRGEGVALEIENEHAVATLSPQTGQLERLRYKRAHGLELFAGGEGHGEPPHIDWAHDYLASNKFQKFRVTNWERVRSYEVVRGPVCTIVRRWGFPHSPLHPVFTAARMLVDVSYVFYAGAPFLLKEGTMRAVQDFELNYLRDDEWVFSGYAFTDLLWMDEAGKAHEGPAPREQAERMWGVGFFHRQSGDAFFSLRLRHELEGGGSARLYHADAPALDYKGHGQLWSRWALRGDPQLRAGDTLSQRNAYLVEPYAADGGKERLEEWRRSLLARLAVSPARDLPPTRGAGAPHGTLAGPGETPADAPLKAAIWDAMRAVPDDMFYTVDANVVDMGYVYDVRLRNGGDVEILLTMPHRGRPQYRYLGRPIQERLASVLGVGSVIVTPVWEPAWTPHRMTDAGWKAMGLDER
ncbi:MAG TPA: metal-sulfur cluster assembly factor, partial [Chloroflexota bacterium]|nr:metal-sulfur cluster assembly factor [Chloroflexota bacterium]